MRCLLFGPSRLFGSFTEDALFIKARDRFAKMSEKWMVQEGRVSLRDVREKGSRERANVVKVFNESFALFGSDVVVFQQVLLVAEVVGVSGLWIKPGEIVEIEGDKLRAERKR